MKCPRCSERMEAFRSLTADKSQIITNWVCVLGCLKRVLRFERNPNFIPVQQIQEDERTRRAQKQIAQQTDRRFRIHDEKQEGVQP